MDVPPGMRVERNKVCKLKKALYGLKQSPRAWFGRFAKSMTKQGYHQSQGAHILFIKRSTSRLITILIVYVNNIKVIGNDTTKMDLLKGKLSKEFEIKDLETLKYFLGIFFFL